MNFCIWPANFNQEINILGLTSLSSPDKLKHSIIKIDHWPNNDVGGIAQSSKPCRIKQCLYLNDGCVYEAKFSKDFTNGCATDQKYENLENGENKEESTTISLVYGPLAKCSVLSLHCGYGVLAAITSSNQVYVWGCSEKGQCGVVQQFVEKPRRIPLKSDDIICEHGNREPGHELSVVSISASKTMCLGLCSDGSLWNWGAITIDEPAQLEPSRVGALYGKQVLAVACGEQHYLALVASEHEFGQSCNKALVSSPNLIHYVDSCEKCREYRAKRKGNMDADDGDTLNWNSNQNLSTDVNFDDSTLFCPLGLRLELSLGSSPPADHIDDSAVFTYDDDVSSTFSMKVKNSLPARFRHLASRSKGDTESANLSLRRRNRLESGEIEMKELRKTKSVGTRFSFTSFEFNVVDAGSSSGSGRLMEDTNSVSSISSLNLFRPKCGRTKNVCASGTRSTKVTSTEVWSWGDNSRGQLGLDDFLSRAEPTPINILNVACISRIDAGDYHSLALSSVGEVWTWGSNSFGQIKQVNVNVQSMPILMKVGSQSSVVDCAAGPDFTVLLVNGLDYRPDIYYCGRDYGNIRHIDDAGTGSGVVVRLNSFDKRYFPVSLHCNNETVIAPFRDLTLSPVLQRIFELICSEIKFASKLKKIYDFSVELCKHIAFGHIEDASLLQSYVETLEKHLMVILEGVSRMKSRTCETKDPLVLSPFLDIVFSSAYQNSLEPLHSAYCQLMAFNIFNGLTFTSSLEKTLLDLSIASDVESSKPYRLLRKLYHVPFSRLDDYCKLVQATTQDKIEMLLNERDALIQFVKRVKVWQQALLNHFHLAENTGHFWSKCIGKTNLLHLKIVNRFLVKEFAKLNGVTSVLENGTSTSWHEVLIFSDSLVLVLKHSHKILEFPLVWIVPVDSDAKFSVQISAPESTWVLDFVDGMAKNDFIHSCNQSIMRHQNGQYTEYQPSNLPPIRRHAVFKFSPKHTLYGDATYRGTWELAKPHGSGEMSWTNGRHFRGKFKAGLMHGFGELKYAESNGGTCIIKGHWKDGNLTGLTITEHADGSRYEGYLKDGQHSGHGIMKQTNTFYVGAWNNDLRHGYGVLDKRKEKYMGMWDSDFENGLGTLVTLEGEYCEGTFDKGVFLKGKLITTDGTKYEGDFNGFGILNGKGTIQFLNGDSVSGTLTGNINDQVKITNGIYKKCQDATTPIDNTWLDSTKAIDDQPVLPADHKWTDIFNHIYDSLGINAQSQSVNGGRLWENVVATLQRLKIFFTAEKNGVDALMDKVPTWDRPMDYTYLEMVFDYCSKAFAVPYHPLGRLLIGLADVFNACYSGIGAHPKLLSHAVAEIYSVVRRMYQLIRYLFPSLPLECQLDCVVMEKPDSCNDDNIKCYEMYGSFFYDSFLQLIYPNLFTLYVLRNESLDRLYWEKISNLNLKNDVTLLDFLGVCKALWPIELKNTDVLDTPLVCATARKQYYAEAIYCLQRLSSEFYPSAKLRVIVETFDKINKCVSLANESGNMHTWTADSLVPVTTYVIVRAQIQRLGAEIQLTEDFSPQLASLGEVQYMFTMLQGCYQHIIQNKTLG